MRANSPPPPHPLLGVPTTCNSSAEDLRRARVQDARACFVLSDRLAGDTEAQDKKALVRALCANQASPPGPGGTSSVLCLVTHTKSKVRLVRLGMPPGSVVCYDEVMEGLVTNASLVSRAINVSLCLRAGLSLVFSCLGGMMVRRRCNFSLETRVSVRVLCFSFPNACLAAPWVLHRVGKPPVLYAGGRVPA